MRAFRFSDLSNRGLPAAAAFVLWALAVGSMALWWLHAPRAVPMGAAAAGVSNTAAPNRKQADVERALGHTSALAAAPDMQKRFAVLGVIATPSGQGSALIEVDGQPARAFVRGQEVADGWRLETVRSDGVRLMPAQAGVTLDLSLPDKR